MFASRIVPFEAGGVARIASAPAADRVVSGASEHGVWNFFTDATGQFAAGVWEATPGRWRITCTESEFCHILAGAGAVIAQDGARFDYAAGSSFVIPTGFVGEWEVTAPTRKLYAVFEPR